VPWKMVLDCSVLVLIGRTEPEDEGAVASRDRGPDNAVTGGGRDSCRTLVGGITARWAVEA
jgi:hypothetical protein